MCNTVKEFNIFTSSDLTDFDRTIVVAYKGQGIHDFTRQKDRWKYSDFYSRHIKPANEIANNALNKMLGAHDD